MERAAGTIIRNRGRILAAALGACILCALLALKVPINTDMTKYLPDTSPMKMGMDLMEEEFPALQMPNTIRVMLRTPAGEEQDEGGAAPGGEDFLSRLQGIEYVSSVAPGGTKNQDGAVCTLYTVSTEYDYQSRQELQIEKDILALKKEGYDLEMVSDNIAGMQIPMLVYVLAVALLLAVLFLMCASWVEPFLFLAAIGIAIVLNLGTNIILGSVSQTTYSMSAILQLVLSMDYSVILMNRYRQEKQKLPARQMQGKERVSALEAAMRAAWQGSFSSIVSSGLTTFAGLFMLVFMRFKIGMDLGLVLAKGVLLSMICVLSVLPALILMFDRAVERSAKKVLYVPTGMLAGVSYRFRWGAVIAFICLFGLFSFTQSRSKTAYSLSPADPIAEVFPPANPVILLYDNADEEKAIETARRMEEQEGVLQVISCGYMLDRQMKPDEMAAYLGQLLESSLLARFTAGAGGEGSGVPAGQMQSVKGMLSEGNLRTLFAMQALAKGGQEDGKLSVSQVFSYVCENLDNPLMGALLDGQMKEQIRGMEGMLSSVRQMLTGPTHSLMMILTDLPVESEQTEGLIRGLLGRLEEEMSGTWYLVGNSPMNVEMKDSFGGELRLITILTAAAIFLVVAVTFRQLLIPLLLVALVQCGVFMTVTTVWVLGYRMYFLAIVIVQCILMGATVDYAILMTNYYREIRLTKQKKEALRETYGKSVHTVLTSALFMIIVTGAIGFSPVDPTIGQICQSIALGALSALVLVMFILPGMLCALDRGVTRR